MARFMTDPHAMRAMAGRFEMHAQTVSDEARKMWASSQNIAGAELERYRSGDLLRHDGPDEPGLQQHRQHAARRARRSGPRREQLRDPRAGLAADPQQLVFENYCIPKTFYLGGRKNEH